MKKSKFSKIKFRNLYEYKISKLNDYELAELQKKIIKELCSSFANELDFYNFNNKNIKS